ncbi:MAG: hypothetical protein C0412_03600 [Flavobacterium sp.]|nr:hypothetical protein [Flavobacterium sp.]
MFSAKTKLSIIKAILTKNSPFYIQYFITSTCNLNCRMCNIAKSNRDIKEASIEDVEKIAVNIKKIGGGVVLLTGGEPFLNKNIARIVKIFISNGLNIRLQSAGFGTSREALKECVDNGARDICVSLDTLNEDLQDYINGVKGSWKKTIETISNISQIFPQRESLCAIGCVLSKYNYKDVLNVVRFATEIGWHVSLVPAHISLQGEGYNFRGNDSSFMFGKEDFPELDSIFYKLLMMKKNGYNLFDSTTYLKSMLYFIKNGKPTWRKKDICDTPNLYFAVLPDGRFAPCCDHRLSDAPSLMDAKFPEIFYSKEFRRAVKAIASSCQGCQYGSYPEMTIMTRCFSDIYERLKLFFKLKFSGIKKLNSEEIMTIINKIKERNVK